MADHDRTRGTASQILVIVTLIPICGSLIALAGIILAGTLICLAIAVPLFLICSPVLIPAAILFAGAFAGVLSAGAFGLTGLSSVSWAFDSFRRATGLGPVEYVKRLLQDAGEMMKNEHAKKRISHTKFALIS